MTILPSLSPKSLAVCAWLAAALLAATSLEAQAPRIQAEVSNSAVTALPGSLHPLARAEYESGRMPASSRLNGISLYFNRSAAQQADLDSLLAAQQDPGSPLYHQWLSPDQFAARFGMAPSDLEKAQTWLEQQGFAIDSVARSHNMIRFSGTAAQVERAFQTEMHFYTVGGVKHFAPSTALNLPGSLGSVVSGVRNLDDFRPRSFVQKSRNAQANPAFTSSVSGSVFFAPGDIKIAYDMNPLLTAGDNGTGQSIVVVGQSSIVNSDIEAFENAAGLTVKDPTQVLVPGSGTAQAFAGDQGESDLDVEWSGGIAPGAEIFFVYTGSNTNYGVFDSLEYAIDEKIGNIISVSYGLCEADLQGSAAIETILQQAATQGQSIVAASGDSGSSACYVSPTTTTPPLATQELLSVSYPASSAYVTGVGGTEITSANDTSGSTYWAAKGSSDLTTSLLQYIPEVVWNDDTAAVQAGATSLSATGGGTSTLYTAKPSWQTGVPGIPADSKRDVPDVAFYASPDLPGYLFCTSDTSDWNTSQAPVQAASCNSGFRDSSSQDLTIAGGTSFSTPIFAGMVAILNQDKGYTAGQGLLNPTLYTLAATASIYSSAFHDVTSGNNECPSSLGTTYCSSTAGTETNYSAGTGYDLTTGLGSIDLAALAGASGWPGGSTMIGTTTVVSAVTTTPASGANDTITITVASATGTTTPTGSVTLSIDGGGTGFNSGGSTQTVTLASGVATYTANFTTAGGHTIVAQYGGDSTHAASSGSITVTVPGSSSGKGTFTVGGTNVTVAQGGTASSTVTVTPSNGYTGTVYLTFDTSNDSALGNLCYSYTTTLSNGEGSVAVTGTTAASTQLTFDTNAKDCATTAVSKSGKRALHRLGPANPSSNRGPSSAPLGIAFAGLLAAGLLGRRAKKLRGVAMMIGLLSLGLGLSACGGGNGSSITYNDPAKGTYTVTLTGTDSTTSTITGKTTFTLTIN